MRINCYEKSINVKFSKSNLDIQNDLIDRIKKNQTILRFIVKSFDEKMMKAHLLIAENFKTTSESHPFFQDPYVYRAVLNQSQFNVAFMIPTGIGCELGGHAGDANPALKLVASVCDQVITHPNTVNASDINEMPDNVLYTEGFHLTNVLTGKTTLFPTRSNRLLVLIEKHPARKKYTDLAINAVNSARATLGIDAQIKFIHPKFKMEAKVTKDKATGSIINLQEVLNTIDKSKNFDAIAISSPILVEDGTHEAYSKSKGKMINPWGAVESMLTHAISSYTGLQSAHAPMIESDEVFFNDDLGVVDARIAPEIVSCTFFHSVLKGLHKAPRAESYLCDSGLNFKKLSALIIPDGCLNQSVLGALQYGIPVIAVNNKNTMKNDLKKLDFPRGKFIQVKNYIEACGVLSALKTGVSIESLRRPLKTLCEDF